MCSWVLVGVIVTGVVLGSVMGQEQNQTSTNVDGVVDKFALTRSLLTDMVGAYMARQGTGSQVSLKILIFFDDFFFLT